MKIKIKLADKKEMVRRINRLRIYQHIDGELVDGIINPNKNYVYWRGWKTKRAAKYSMS